MNATPELDIHISQCIDNDIARQIIADFGKHYGLWVQVFDVNGTILMPPSFETKVYLAVADAYKSKAYGQMDAYHEGQLAKVPIAWQQFNLGYIKLGRAQKLEMAGIDLTVIADSLQTDTEDLRNVMQAMIDPVDAVFENAITWATKVATQLALTALREYKCQTNQYKGNDNNFSRIANELIQAKEVAEESNRLKTAFLHNITHEIRTPLNAITGFSQFLVSEHLDASKRKMFSERIIAASNRLLDILTDVLEISQVQARQITLSKSVVNLKELMHILIQKFNVRCVEKNLRLITELNVPANYLNCHSDQYKLYKICKHLIDNALKFTHKGSITITCSPHSDDFLRFEVSDTGIGIVPGMQQKIFEPFRQIESGLSRNYGGNGVGLSICKSYVELLGGEIWLKSVENVGTTFSFTIPFQEAIPYVIASTTDALPDLSTKSILIVDDETENLTVLNFFVSKTKAKITNARNGKIALDLCRNVAAFDAILMDIKMPEMDGHTAARLIKEFRPEIPIIAQTSYASEADKNAFLESGFDDYITKPIDSKALYNMLVKWTRIAL